MHVELRRFGSAGAACAAAATAAAAKVMVFSNSRRDKDGFCMSLICRKISAQSRGSPAERSVAGHRRSARVQFAMLNAFGYSVLRVSVLVRLAQIAFFAALIFTFYSAVVPPAHAVQIAPWDKAEHFIAFYALTGLAVAAFPKRNLLVIVVFLSGFGALIEFVQGLSHRASRSRFLGLGCRYPRDHCGARPDAVGVVARAGQFRSEEHRHIDLIDRGVEFVQRLRARQVLRHAVVLDVAKIEIVEAKCG